MNPAFQLVVPAGSGQLEGAAALGKCRIGLPHTREAGAAHPPGPALPPGIVAGQLHRRVQRYPCAIGAIGADEGVGPPQLSRPEVGGVVHQGEGISELAVEWVGFEKSALVPETVGSKEWGSRCARRLGAAFTAG